MREVDKRRGPEAGSGQKTPTQRQQQILAAFFVLPNAAAVGRSLGCNERTVRRVVQQFNDLLVERRQQRFEEELQRSDARHARVHDWADAALGQALERLDELAASEDEGVALRATKLKLNLALPVISAASSPRAAEEDGLLRLLQRELDARIAGLERDADRGDEHA
jgi:hypothetical protein